MRRQGTPALLAFSLIAALTACDKVFTKPTPPLTASKDFWIDRCDLKYRGRDFPVTGTVEDMVRLLGPYDRLDTLTGRHFWDSLGLQVTGYRTNGQIGGVDIYFGHEISESESGLRMVGRPEDLAAADEIHAGYPHGFFKGEMVLEGALIGPVIDFSKVNDTRYEYLKKQTGPDAHLQSIRESWSATRYAYERTCADGKQYGFIFTLLSSVPPLRLESISIGSDNIQDSVYMPDSVYRPGSVSKPASTNENGVGSAPEKNKEQ